MKFCHFLAQEGMLCIDYNITFTPVTNEAAFVHCSRAMSNGQVLEHHRCFEGRLEKREKIPIFFQGYYITQCMKIMEKWLIALTALI